MTTQVDGVAISRGQRTQIAEIKAILIGTWMQGWAPHLSTDAVRRFEQSDPAGAYLDACIDDIDVASRDGQVLGMVHVVGDLLASLHVARAAQGTGVGSILLAHAERNGARRLDVRAFNTGAIAFYERHGWHRTRTCVGLEMGDSVETFVMEKPGP